MSDKFKFYRCLFLYRSQVIANRIYTADGFRLNITGFVHNI